MNLKTMPIEKRIARIERRLERQADTIRDLYQKLYAVTLNKRLGYHRKMKQQRARQEVVQIMRFMRENGNMLRRLASFAAKQDSKGKHMMFLTRLERMKLGMWLKSDQRYLAQIKQKALKWDRANKVGHA